MGSFTLQLLEPWPVPAAAAHIFYWSQQDLPPTCSSTTLVPPAGLKHNALYQPTSTKSLPPELAAQAAGSSGKYGLKNKSFGDGQKLTGMRFQMILTHWRYSAAPLVCAGEGIRLQSSRDRWTWLVSELSQCTTGGRGQPCILLLSAAPSVDQRRPYRALRNSSSLDFTCLYLHSHTAPGSREAKGCSGPATQQSQFALPWDDRSAPHCISHCLPHVSLTSSCGTETPRLWQHWWF